MARKELDKEKIYRGKVFAQKVRDGRTKLSLSQDDLSKKANVSVDTIRSIETERLLSPGLFIAVDLVQALGGKLEEWVLKKNKTKRVRT